MTLYSRANLKVSAVASTNPFDGPLNGVQLDPDGATIACNGNGLVAVGPTRAETHFPDVGPRGKPEPQRGTILRPEFIKEVETIIPKDKRVSLQHVALTVGRDITKTEFTTVDKSGRERRIAEHPKRERYPDWRKVVSKALTPKEGKSVTRVCVGKKTLLNVLQTLVDATPDSGDEPIFLEIGSGIVIRATNRETGQHVVGVAAAYNVGDQWMEKDQWEKTIVTDGVYTLAKKILMKKKKE